jgi:hypothetical protein
VWRTGSSDISLETIFEKSIHSSWLIAWFGLGILIGTYISLYFSLVCRIRMGCSSICLAVVSFINKKLIAVILILLSGISFGLWRGSIEIQAQSGFEQYFGENVQAVGVVSEDPTYDTDGDLRFKLKNVVIENNNIAGELWVSDKRPKGHYSIR